MNNFTINLIPQLAQTVVDASTIQFVAPLLQSPDAKLRRQVCSTLAQIAKHTVDLAESVVDGEIFPCILNCLKDTDTYVRKNSATLICEIAKHTPEVLSHFIEYSYIYIYI